MAANYASTIASRVDAEGRVSVPAPFRAALAQEGGAELFCFLSDHCPAIVACGPNMVARLRADLEALDPFSPEYTRLAMQRAGRAASLSLDAKGRVMLPAELRAAARIGGEAAFVGLMTHIMIWSPSELSAYEARAASAA